MLRLAGADPGIVHVDAGVVAAQLGDDVDHPGVAQVRAVLLERQAQHQDARARTVWTPRCGHQLDQLLGDVAAHAVVDAAAGQDHLGVVADLPAALWVR